ncbi:MAG: hypothetical protein LBB09_02745 [Rickettsiales bacterium]|jgi:aspartyl/asparaginyl-tRNA synthetase|nr:hypothetical protein [Rickettsiales bacterium]
MSKIKTYFDGDRVYQQDVVDAANYSQTIALLRSFFSSRGFLETPTQSRLSILAACEDPTTVAVFNFLGNAWPLPQTGQMWLEYELLTNPKAKGFYCVSTSYREEKNPIPGRHRVIFPMFEFETHGTQEDLKKLEIDLLKHLGLDADGKSIKEVSYEKAASFYGVTEISAAEENKMTKDFAKNVLLCDFPTHTSPFWNMKLFEDKKKAKKIDVIIEGMETIGSAERSSNKEEMKHMFHNISDGLYAKSLFDKFGKERVENELEDYFKFNFFPRCGGGIGVTRLISALLKNKVIG